MEVPPGFEWHRVHWSTWGYDEPNPGHGDTRFAPFEGPSGRRIPTMYMAESVEAALLESVFHDVDENSHRVYESSLRGRLLASVTNPKTLLLADLTDDILDRESIPRASVSSSPAEHYPCTRKLARHIYGTTIDGEPPMGIIWDSRQVELHHQGTSKVMIVFTNRYDMGRGGWPLTGHGSQSLTPFDASRVLRDVATRIGATISPGQS